MQNKPALIELLAMLGAAEKQAVRPPYNPFNSHISS